MVKPFAFAHIKAVTTLPPPQTPKLLKSDIAPSESIKPKVASESVRRGPSTVAELLEQERAVRAQSRNAPSSPISPAEHRKNSTPSTTSNEHTPTCGERPDRAVVERRRLHIHNMVTWTKKRDVVRMHVIFELSKCRVSIRHCIRNTLSIYCRPTSSSVTTLGLSSCA